MLMLSGAKLSFKYSNQSEPILENLDLSVNSNSRIGLAGKNGSGKTTLLDLLQGSKTPLAGLIYREKSLRVGRVNQTHGSDVPVKEFLRSFDLKYLALWKSLIDQPSDELSWEAFDEFELMGGYQIECKLEALVEQFGLSHLDLTLPMKTLSGGERSRMGILRVLLSSPNLLLLDEPSNYMDKEGLVWLTGFLEEIQLPFVLVSHERELLDSVTNETWELSRKSLECYGYSYSEAMKFKELKLERDQEAYQRQRDKISSLKVQVEIRRNQALKMQNHKDSRSVKKNGGLCKRDETVGNFRPENKMRSAMALKNRVEKMEVENQNLKPDFEKNRRLEIPCEKSLRVPYGLQVPYLKLKYGLGERLPIKDLYWSPKTRINITGRNGCGKSTFLKTLMGELDPQAGEVHWNPGCDIGYFSQCVDLVFDCRDSLLSYIWDPKKTSESNARRLLGSLGFPGNRVMEKVSELSPGEQSKVKLAKILLGGHNVLILDEPFGHLDIRSKEMLESALSKYPGMLILVSHDEYINKALELENFKMDGGGSVRP